MQKLQLLQLSMPDPGLGSPEEFLVVGGMRSTKCLLVKYVND